MQAITEEDLQQKISHDDRRRAKCGIPGHWTNGMDQNNIILQLTRIIVLQLTLES